MSIERVREFFRAYGMEARIRELDGSSATVPLAAQALGCEPCRIAKTLAFTGPEGPVLLVTAGDARVDNARYKTRFHVKARMLSDAELAELIGHPAGGVCPFALRTRASVYLDISLKRFDTVFPACGSANSAIELSLAELERCADAVEWVDLCRDWDIR